MTKTLQKEIELASLNFTDAFTEYNQNFKSALGRLVEKFGFADAESMASEMEAYLLDNCDCTDIECTRKALTKFLRDAQIDWRISDLESEIANLKKEKEELRNQSK